MKKLMVIVLAGLIVGCTDGQMGKLKSYGGSAKIDCYSGTKLIYSGQSTGKVSSEKNSDGYNFIDKETGRLREVSGNCVIDYLHY